MTQWNNKHWTEEEAATECAFAYCNKLAEREFAKFMNEDIGQFELPFFVGGQRELASYLKKACDAEVPAVSDLAIIFRMGLRHVDFKSIAIRIRSEWYPRWEGMERNGSTSASEVEK